MTVIPKAADWISPNEYLGWQSEHLEGPGSILKLPGLGVEIPLERIYERTTLPKAKAPAG